MHRLPIALVAAALLGLATPAVAQDQPAPADPDTIAFDLGKVDDGDEDWGIGDYLARQPAAEQAACGNDSDLLAAQSTSSPRYDENGALIRQVPDAARVPPGSRYGALARSVRAEEQRRA